MPLAPLRFRTTVVDFSRCYVMGIVNMTPDSFSDGGRFPNATAAIQHAMRLVEEGADFIDVGGESSRPRGLVYGAGASMVSADDEIRRILPIVEYLSTHTDVVVSVDTTKAIVAAASLDAGAQMINDISGLSMDPAMVGLVARAKCPVVLMHMRGNPTTTHTFAQYDDVVEDVVRELSDRVRLAIESGVAPEHIVVDPGLGFGKDTHDNIRLVAGLKRLRALGFPVLVGASRKAFIGKLSQVSEPSERIFGSLGALAAGCWLGANIVRVHDVAPTKQMLAVLEAISDVAASEVEGSM